MNIVLYCMYSTATVKLSNFCELLGLPLGFGTGRIDWVLDFQFERSFLSYLDS